MIEALAGALVVWSMAVSIVSAVAISRSRRCSRHAHGLSGVSSVSSGSDVSGDLERERARETRCTVVRPCAGAEPFLLRSLRSSRWVAELGSKARVVLAISGRADAAYPIVVSIADELRRGGIDVCVVETGATELNAKSGQIAAALTQVAPRSDDELLVICDSDVELQRGDLHALIRPVIDGEVETCWAPPYESEVPQFMGDRASRALLGGSLHAFTLLSGIDDNGLVGKLFVLRADTLASIGGFDSLTDVLGEDMEIARRLRAQGRKIGVSPRPIRSLASGRSWRDIVERTTRWLQVIRAQRPALLLSYPALFFATPLVLASALVLTTVTVVDAAMSPSTTNAAQLASGVEASAASSGNSLVLCLSLLSSVLVIGARFGVVIAARRSTGRSRKQQSLLVDTTLSDLLLAMAFLRTLTSTEVMWRGRKLSLSKGRLVPIAARTASWTSAFLLVATVAISQAFALPKAGDQGLNARLEDADGKVIELKQFSGKPILIVYESKEASKQNETLKKELATLAKGDKYKDKVALAAVADLEGYNYFPVKGFVKDSIRAESKKAGTTIYCDWDAGVRGVYGFRKGSSSVVLIDKNGWVIFAQDGPIEAEGRARLIELLRKQVE